MASVRNNREQISITCRELIGIKKSLTNGKIYGMPGITDRNKINNWKEGIKGQSIWINRTLEEQKEIKAGNRLLTVYCNIST